MTHTNTTDLPKVILALDLPSESEAMDLVDKLSGANCIYKVGLEAFCAGIGVSLMRTLTERGLPVFADLKLLDIPATVSRAVAAVSSFKPCYLTVHAQSAALEAAVATAGPTGILAVTLLTSVDNKQLRDMGHQGSAEDYVVEKARLAVDTGCAGVVCSPREAAAVKAATGDRLSIVTPGIRSANAIPDDQARVASVADALAAGADHVVVGRQVRDAPDPKEALEEILAEAGVT